MSDIEITNARENNLRNVSLKIPKRQITVFTGVSGSGKSSIVFDTIATESQRLLNETFSSFARNRMPKYGRPDADAVENLSAAVVIGQRRIGGNSRSTVGTITDVHPLLRLLYSREGRPYAGYSNAFSFNDPAGMCPGCQGLGRRMTLDLDRAVDRTKSLNEGALLLPGAGVGTWLWKMYTTSGLFDNDRKLADYTEREWETLLHGQGPGVSLKTRGGAVQQRYEGLVTRFDRLYVNRDGESESGREAAQLAFVSSAVCPVCRGARLNRAALDSRIEGRNIAELCAMEIGDLVEVVATITGPVAETLTAAIMERLRHLVSIGLGYLSLDRETSTLSGGESQRIKIVRHLGGGLTDMTYIFDEPTIGLHPRDVVRMNGLLRKLRDKGNTVIVVEHDRDVIEIADHVVDVGPYAGTRGGEIVYEGGVAGLRESGTLTGRHMRDVRPPKETFREPTGALTVTGANARNLKDVTVSFPTGVLAVVTGVAGSGKSTLVNEVFLRAHPGAVVVDQSAVGTSVRSTPATYTGLMDEVRGLFARAAGVSPSLFSFNSEGACPNCQGLGVVHVDLAFMEGVTSRCGVCRGRRFKEEVLRHTLRGRSVLDVLEMTAAQAADFFTEPKPRRVLRALNEVGLGYLRLGQPLSSLSGGECQRIKLASELRKTGSVYVMDEPTTGLHMADVEHLLTVMDGLVDAGNSVIVIEHNLDVVKNADWVIDLGPEGGDRGGTVVFEGTPGDLLKATGSLTAEHLRRSAA
ncbi:ATP-binding cassette domain-containing protein [Streptosporangium saharense]|uniref:UvrABC system protein A n=1 Tax=Streptosporangium saharense TaxID=1706840 RepID=A0A7W7VND6_9ACTN|nr:excinuclease ABC subunit UvrA [Streptosporangium saharense]MBB4916786.1 excinuclease UvrABC ATPase subunit [Streptosporangium saharense]